MSPNTGLSPLILHTLQTLFAAYPQIQRVKLYGSRAKGTFTDRSDIDLALFGSELNTHIMGQLYLELDESDIPFKIDLTWYDDLKNHALIEHIDRVGILIFSAIID